MSENPEKAAASDVVQQRREGAIAIVTLNNPARRNAWSAAMREQAFEVFSALMRDPACRAIVVTGAGGTFCSGGDLSGMGPTTLLDRRDRMALSHRTVRLLVEGRKPVVAAVEGYAFGAGMSLALCCDYVVTASNAKFSAAFVRVGLVPDLGLFWTLPQRVGLGTAKKMLALATQIDGVEAVRIGAADELAEPGQALSAAMVVAAQFAALAPVSLALIKSAMAGRSTTLDEALRAEIDYQSTLSQTADHAEGVAAFLEKRKPVFTGT